jgi:uncharacterized protein YecE (DUF72 family)
MGIFNLISVKNKEITMILYDDTPIYIGTAGYKFEDWINTFYPRNIKNENMLGFYSKTKGLKFLELTFTFYTDPTNEITSNIAENSASDLMFSVRLPKRFMKFPPSPFDAGRFRSGLAPIADRVKAYFADFFYAFAPSRANLEHIATLRDRFSDKPFFVELANRGWYKQKYLEELKELNVGLVICDYPTASGLAPYTLQAYGRNAYFRLYGNSPLWDSHTNRSLDYDYKERELTRVMKDAGVLTSLADNVFISFCNSTKGYAAKNALELSKMFRDRNCG